MKNIWLIVGGLLVLIAGSYFLFVKDGGLSNYTKEEVPVVNVVPENTEPIVAPVKEDITEPVVAKDEPVSVIGQSFNKNDIVAYHFGNGTKEIMFMSGIHGGYSWNTALLGFELVDWFEANQDKIPADVKVTIIPVLNPDGLKETTGKTGRFSAAVVCIDEMIKVAGRYNGNEVDLIRNFACEWQSVGTWQIQEVSGGATVFSEPESKAVQAYVAAHKPIAVVTWYSAAGGVYSSNCKNGALPETLALTNLFAKASGYKAYEEFNYYEITGDMVNWLASQNIPAISVLLTDRVQTEFSKNIAGVEAILNHYAN
jgi:hypothetical protein